MLLLNGKRLVSLFFHFLLLPINFSTPTPSQVLYCKIHLVKITARQHEFTVFFSQPVFFHFFSSRKNSCTKICTWDKAVAVDTSSEVYHEMFPKMPLTSWRLRVVAAPAFALSEFPTARTFTGRFSSTMHRLAVAS